MNTISGDWLDASHLPEPPLTPSCLVGVMGHEWTLEIGEGSVGLTSKCDQCDEAVLGPMGTQILEMDALRGLLKFRHEHEGRPHGYGVCDCNYWWEFMPANGGAP